MEWAHYPPNEEEIMFEDDGQRQSSR